jgi:hypothetical protein
MRSQRAVNTSRVEQITQGALNAESIQRFLLSLSTVVTQFGSGLADLASLA